MKLLVFTYAPAGLGHLRVTDALVESRPKDAPYVLLGSYDRFITRIHRFTSTNPIAKMIFLWAQYGLGEDIFTRLYRHILIKTAGPIKKQLLDIIVRHHDVSEIQVIATHFGMAHQIGAIKEELMTKTGVAIRLFVQVTDDTSQHIWCIKGADITFVPSLHTKEELEAYSKKRGYNLNFVVVPYPISPNLTEKILPPLKPRGDVFANDTDDVHVAVPISGASVGLSYSLKIIKSLSEKSKRFKFWVVVKQTMYTEMFLATLKSMSNVRIISGRNDNEMISLYELLYQNNLIHLEITKPSEQSFKAILHPSMVGGSVILFTEPVGRQEFDNLDFLTRHKLLPQKSNGTGFEHLTEYPRAFRLPSEPLLASEFIMWCLKSGIFVKMTDKNYQFPVSDNFASEVGSNGSLLFWKAIESKYS